MNSKRQVRVYSGRLAQSIANAIQMYNFASDRLRRTRSRVRRRDFSTIYRHAVASAFSLELPFIVTGAPHARAYYPRNFAWFYPALLDPATIVSEEDAEARVVLMERSARLVLESVRSGNVTTTLVPLTKRRMLGANYFSPPSDSLLGSIAALDQLIEAPAGSAYEDVYARARAVGQESRTEYGNDLRTALTQLAGGLERVKLGKRVRLLCDASKARSSATDTRAEKLRFVTNANTWTTFARAVDLGIIDDQTVARLLGRTLKHYKADILDIFGDRGYVRHSLEREAASVAADVSLDFAHTQHGFWDLSDTHERRLFRATADIVLNEAAFRNEKTGLYLMSVRNPRRRAVHRVAAPSYQGRTVWPAFNTEFADRLLDLGAYERAYADEARRILRAIRQEIEKHGAYPELLSREGKPYKTWAYKSAAANSWLPRFVSVWTKAFDEHPFNPTR